MDRLIEYCAELNVSTRCVGHFWGGSRYGTPVAHRYSYDLHMRDLHRLVRQAWIIHMINVVWKGDANRILGHTPTTDDPPWLLGSKYVVRSRIVDPVNNASMGVHAVWAKRAVDVAFATLRMRMSALTRASSSCETGVDGTECTLS